MRNVILMLLAGLCAVTAFLGSCWAVAAAMDGVLAIIPTLAAITGLAGFGAGMETLEKEDQDDHV